MRNWLGLMFVLAACGKSQPPPPPPEPDPEPTPAPVAAPVVKAEPKHAKTPEELGKCHLTASGAVTADQTSPGGRNATNVSYWYTEAERKTMMGVDGFVVNCIGTDIKFQLVPGGGKIDGMPFKPKKYTFAKGKGDANIAVAFGKATLATPSGTIDITAFDTHHIAGTIDLVGKLAPGNGEVKLKGEFDLACAGLKGCDL